MSKCLAVVALSVLVLSGAIGLRNLVSGNAATITVSNLSAPSFPNGPGPIPPNPGSGGGGHFTNGPGPIPPNPGSGGGGH